MELFSGGRSKGRSLFVVREELNFARGGQVKPAVVQKSGEKRYPLAA
jgi:hypothetical protein